MKHRTAADLAVQAAQHMNLLRPGQPMSARDGSVFQTTYENLLAELIDRKAAYWRADEIPAAIFNRLAWLLAIEVAPAFGMLPIVLNAIQHPDAQSARDYYIRELREHREAAPAYEPLEMSVI